MDDIRVGFEGYDFAGNGKAISMKSWHPDNPKVKDVGTLEKKVKKKIYELHDAPLHDAALQKELRFAVKPGYWTKAELEAVTKNLSQLSNTSVKFILEELKF